MRKLEPETDQRKTVIAKIIFLTLLIITAFLTHMVSKSISQKPKLQASQKNQPQVLGTASTQNLQKNIIHTIADLEDKTKDLQGTIQKEASQLFEQKKSEVETSVSSAVYGAAIKPLITQFQALPPQEQETVRGAICK